MKLDMYFRRCVVLALGFSVLCGGISTAQSDDDKHLVTDYLFEADKSLKEAAYRFDCQMTKIDKDGDQRIRTFFGIVAKSEKNAVEYYSYNVASDETVGAPPEPFRPRYSEMLRIGAKRHRKMYLVPLPGDFLERPGDPPVKNSSSSQEIELDDNGKPLNSFVPRLCPFVCSISSVLRAEDDRTNLDLLSNLYLNTFVFKSSQIVNGRIETEWYGPQKQAVLTSVFDPELDYVLVEFRVHLVKQNGLVERNFHQRTRTEWRRDKKEVLRPVKIKMEEHSHRDVEAEINFKWFDEEQWQEVASKTNWSSVRDRQGTAWFDFFNETFSEKPKKVAK
jgi:hypothetical protein